MANALALGPNEAVDGLDEAISDLAIDRLGMVSRCRMTVRATLVDRSAI
jgi:hypothetical protein